MIRGYACIGLDRPKTKENIGSAIRAAFCYDARLIVVSQARLKRSITDTVKGYRHLPVQRVDDLVSAIPYDCIPVAVELVDDASSLVDYRHPQRAFYIFGPEDGQIRKDILGHCRDKIMVPMRGCMNLAAAVNVILYDRMAKQARAA